LAAARVEAQHSMKNRNKSPLAEAPAPASVVESLKFRRKELGLTLHEVARRSGLSPAFISLAERHKAVPSIVSLIALAKALEVDINYFLTPPKIGKILRRANEPEIFPMDSPVTYVRLSAGHRGQMMDSFLFTIPAGPTFPRVHRDGESFYYVLLGRLHFEVGDDVYELGPGDSLHFNSQHRYNMQNRGTKDVQVLWVGTPPLFPATTAKAQAKGQAKAKAKSKSTVTKGSKRARGTRK
jgi:transcriptional regulator with XRE-family HTH domain